MGLAGETSSNSIPSNSHFDNFWQEAITMTKMSVEEFFEWLAKKLFAFVLVPYFTYLGYFTQIRPYFEANHGEYTTGFVDGVTLMLTVFVFGCYAIAKIWIVGRKKE